MEENILWLMGLCLLFFAIGVWCGWAVWGKPTLTYRRPMTMRERSEQIDAAGRKAMQRNTAAELWESDPHNTAN